MQDLDALTGRRSRVRRYIQQNQATGAFNRHKCHHFVLTQSHKMNWHSASGCGKTAATGFAARYARAGDPPKSGPTDTNSSPEYRMFEATGLNSRREISDVLKALQKNRPLLRPAINNYNKM